MWRSRTEVMPETVLENVNAVTIASCAVQQLPKLLHAMSNMARRSRRQFHRRGIFLGGHWLDKGSQLTSSSLDIQIPEEVPRKGILKKNNEPGLDQLSAYNEFWKAYSFSFDHDYDVKPNHCCPTSWRPYLCSKMCKPHPVFAGQLCTQNCQKSLYKPQTQTFLESFPSHLTSLRSLQSILFRHLSHVKLTVQEQEILFQLQYLKILLNTPLHKLVRERPKEFLIPLPRRHSRGTSAVTPYTRSLTTYQAVLTLPNPEPTFKWLSFTNLTFGKSTIFGFGNNDARESLRYKRRSRTTVPKGVAFITYPDSVDETSFEGTIGGRNVISWEKGTKFPQMGIDQSKEFKYKKEMGKQQMIQSRIRAARIYRRIYCDNWNNYVNGSKQGVRRSFSSTKGFRRNTTSERVAAGIDAATHSLLKTWFKLAQLKQSLRVLMNNQWRGTSSRGRVPAGNVQSRGGVSNGGRHRLSNAAARKAARKAEQRRRLKICLMTIVKYLTCGLVPYILKGECKIFKRKTLRTTDSRERCPTPPLPDMEAELVAGFASVQHTKLNEYHHHDHQEINNNNG